MVGAEHVDDALRDAAPDAVAVARCRAPAGSSAAACRAAHSRRPTASDDAASPRRSRHPCGASRNAISSAVEMCSTWMRAPRLAGDARPAARVAAQRRDLVAPDRMRGRIAGDAQAEPLAQPVLVLGVEGGAAARVPQDRGDALVVLDQQVAGREPMNTLMPAAPGSRSSSPTSPALSRVPPTQKAKSQCMRCVRAPHLVGKRLGAGRQRVGVGHLEDGGDAAEHGGARAALEIFLVLQARLAEMHLAVDDAGQDVQAAAVDRRAGARRAEIADRGDAAAADADVAQARAVMVDDRAALQDRGRRWSPWRVEPLPVPCARLT